MVQNKKIKKVLLITPPAYTFKDMPDINPLPPIGLGYLAAILEKKGIEVEIFDSLIEGIGKEELIEDNIIRIGSSFGDIEAKIRSFSPDIVGVSNLFSRQARNAHEIYKITKSIDPKIIVIAGGAHPTVMPESVILDQNVDFVILGEGERTLEDLIGHLEGKIDLGKLNGIAYRTGSKPTIVPKINFILDIDSLPFPARHLMKLDKYFGLSESHGKRRCKRFTPIVTSRGCPVGCTFCTAHHVWGRNFRKRSPENVLAEMRELKDKYNIEELLFEDDNVTLDVKRAESIFDMMISEKLNFKWDTPNGVAAFALDERLIKKMQDAGCYHLNIAVESGSPRVLKEVIKKPLDLDKVERLIKFTRKINLESCIFLIIGMPGETLKDMWDSYKYAKKIGVYKPFVSVATPYPGSLLYDLCLEKKYIKKGFSLNDLYITSCSIQTREWNSEDVRKLFSKGFFYLQMEHYKKHPIEFAKKAAVAILKNPIRTLKKVGLLCQNMKS